MVREGLGQIIERIMGELGLEGKEAMWKVICKYLETGRNEEATILELAGPARRARAESPDRGGQERAYQRLCRPSTREGMLNYIAFAGRHN